MKYAVKTWNYKTDLTLEEAFTEAKIGRMDGCGTEIMPQDRAKTEMQKPMQDLLEYKEGK